MPIYVACWTAISIWSQPPSRRHGQNAWYKTTITCFRLTELAEHFADFGWHVRPLLVVRAMRSIWASLISKPYGRNGTTAEDPPLRMRFRRFLADWQEFRSQRLPVVQFENLTSEPEATLRSVCVDLGMGWDQGMLTWPKRPDELGKQRGGNESFLRSRGRSLTESLQRHNRASALLNRVAADDWHWLQRKFEEYNRVCGYEPELPCPGGDSPSSRHGPSFVATRRYQWETRRKPWRRLLSWLGIPNRRLIDSRTAENLV